VGGRLRATALVAAGAIGGCGPTQSTSLLIDVHTAMAVAQRRNAAEVAPYEMAAAAAYRAKAQEEQSTANYEDAVALATVALACAQAAIARVRDPDLSPPVTGCPAGPRSGAGAEAAPPESTTTSSTAPEVPAPESTTTSSTGPEDEGS
jgi:hypothetical protein